MVWKCCTQYASKFEKLSGHRTGKGQFSLQSLRKAMPKNVQTTAQLHSSHTIPKRRQRHPIPVLLPGKSHGQRSLMGCHLWGRPELDMTEWLHFSFFSFLFEHSFALPFFDTGMKTDLFQSCGLCWVFQICWHIECSTFTASSFRIWNSSTGIISAPLALFVVMLPKAHLTSHSRSYVLKSYVFI